MESNNKKKKQQQKGVNHWTFLPKWVDNYL